MKCTFKAEVKYRVDGVLIRHIELDKNIMSLVISRIKVISNLDISEKEFSRWKNTNKKLLEKLWILGVSILPTFMEKEL